MKLQSSKTQNRKILLNANIFDSIKVPEKIKGISEIHKYITKVRNSIKLLDISKYKEKPNIKNIFHPSKSVIIKNKNEEKRKINYQSRFSLPSYETKNNNEKINKSKLYKDKLSILKEKNKKILNKMIKIQKNRNSQNIIINNINNGKKSLDKNNDDIFMTRFNSLTTKNNNQKKYKEKENAITELNETKDNKDYLNINRMLKNKSNKIQLPKIVESKSTRNGLTIDNQYTRNNQIKIYIMKPNKSFDINRKNANITNNSNSTLEQNSKDNISGLNKKLVELFGYNHKYSNPKNPQMIKFRSRLNNLKKILRKKNYEYELNKWIMSSKFKYAKWKFGINDLDKYFTDVEELGIKEKNELELRKSFYKKIDLLINQLREEKEIREIKEREKAYGIDINKEDSNKKVKDNEYWIDDMAKNKMVEQNIFLKKAKERKLKEQKNREIIDNILLKCKQRAFNINNM